MDRFSSPHRQSGVALVAVLLIFALIGVLATGMLNRQRLQVNQSINLQGQTQAYEYALGAEQFARQVLALDYNDDKKKNQFTDHGEEAWSKYSAAFPIENGGIEMQLDDLQGRFNINSLVDKNGKPNDIARKRFENLLFQLGIRDLRVEPVMDWLDSNDQAMVGGAEDEAYLVKVPPYRAANAPMQSTSELLLVEGVTADDYDKLEPYLAALPSNVTAINVNTAPAAILRCLDSRITQQQAESIVDQRGNKGFKTLQDFLAVPELAGLGMQSTQLSVNTEYFQLTARAIFDDRSSRLVSVIRRDKQGKLSILRRDQGLKYAITKEVVNIQ